jgi:hypothetical protein
MFLIGIRAIKVFMNFSRKVLRAENGNKERKKMN